MKYFITFLVLSMLFSCKENLEARRPIKQVTVEDNITEMQKKLNNYVSFKLTSDLSVLSENERKMLPILINVADKMNELFWYESYGNKNELLNQITDQDAKNYIEINYGPWDRLDGDKSFVESIESKPLLNAYKHCLSRRIKNARDVRVNCEVIEALDQFVQ